MMTCQNVTRDEEVMTERRRKRIKSPFDYSTCQVENIKLLTEQPYFLKVFKNYCDLMYIFLLFLTEKNLQ